MENQWSSSGWYDIPRTHYTADPPRNPQKLWQIWIVNQNISKDELASCRCSTTSNGEMRTTKTGSFLGPGSETKWNNTLNVKPGGQWNDVAELMLNNFQESITQYFVQLVLWNEELWRVKEVENYPHISAVITTQWQMFLVNQISIYTELGRFVWGISQTQSDNPLTGTGQFVTMEKSETLVSPGRFVKRFNITSLVIWWSCGLSRVHFTLWLWIIKAKIMDSWKHQDRSCIGSGDQLQSKKVWRWDQN